MSKLIIPIALKKALTPLLTRKLFYGAAISCAVGIGVGVWLEPPKAHYASAATTVTLPQERANLWGEDASVSSLSAGQPASASVTDQSAAVSPPAGTEPVQLAQADRSEAAASGDTSQAQPAQAAPTQVAYPEVQPQRPVAPPPDRAGRQGRDWATYDSRPRDNEDYLDDPPPPPWAGRPERRPPMQDRHWDFRPDGPAVPLDDEDDGGG